MRITHGTESYQPLHGIDTRWQPTLCPSRPLDQLPAEEEREASEQQFDPQPDLRDRAVQAGARSGDALDAAGDDRDRLGAALALGRSARGVAAVRGDPVVGAHSLG